MKILVINCGSSSLKYQLFDMSQHQSIASGLVERIGISNPILTHHNTSQKYVFDQEQQQKYLTIINDHKSAVALVSKILTDPVMGSLSSMSEINAVGHRVVHGGEKYAQAVIINEDVIKTITECNVLAPLHNPANLTGIKATMALMPNIPMVAIFDTAFHQTMPAQAYIYSLPYEIYTKYQVRRYGFHGTSHSYVANQAAKFLNQDIKQLKLITCHLGNGASIAAVKYGQSVDTSMGFTPLAGLTMGTRCGDIDPSIIPYLAQQMNLSLDEIDTLMNKKSGVLGLSGISNDLRDVEQAAANGNERAKLTLTVYVYQIQKYIGAYIAAMNGVDAIIFTAGVGENGKEIRQAVIDGISFFGVTIDPQKNNIRGELAEISQDGCRVKALLVPTNEELMIAKETLALI